MAVLAILVALTAVFPAAGQTGDNEGGLVRFANSCSAEVQTGFSQAITALHSFEYLESARLFGEVAAVDPACVMAYWGAAMSVWHPLWAKPGQAQLEEGARLLALTDGLDATPREAAYVAALKAFFASTDTGTHGDRARAYETRMAALYADNLDDPEAAIFYALSLLATADPRDKSYAHHFKAAGLLNWVRASQPTHPGVLHYIIHSYDFPGLAHLALDAAKTYAGAAPDSAHAQHMPSHIFTRLGLWDFSIASNHDSTASAADYTVKAGLSGHYDDGLHGMDYLVYAMMQTARDEEAREVLVALGNIAMTNTENFKVAFAYAAAPARYVLERRQWQEASTLELLRPDFPWQDFGRAAAINHFARGIGAARSGQSQKARQEWAVIKDLQAGLPEPTRLYWRVEVQVELDAVMSWILLAEGETGEALRLASNAATREDAVDKDPVTPGEVLPARELYADMLLETGDFAGALDNYHLVLSGSPNRLNALLGAARAAGSLGDRVLSQSYFAIACAQTDGGNNERQGLAGKC